MTVRCAFCSIVDRDESAHVVFDDELVVAFLDARPVFHGHLLVVPREHVETLPELMAGDVGPYFERVQRLSVAVQDAMGAQGTFVAINNKVSQSVPHLHTHVVPRTKGDGLKGFFWPRTRYEGDDQAAAVAAQIAERLAPQEL